MRKRVKTNKAQVLSLDTVPQDAARHEVRRKEFRDNLRTFLATLLGACLAFATQNYFQWRKSQKESYAMLQGVMSEIAMNGEICKVLANEKVEHTHFKIVDGRLVYSPIFRPVSTEYLDQFLRSENQFNISSKLRVGLMNIRESTYAVFLVEQMFTDQVMPVIRAKHWDGQEAKDVLGEMQVLWGDMDKATDRYRQTVLGNWDELAVETQRIRDSVCIKSDYTYVTAMQASGGASK